ncbi:UspA domain protein OS=Tsukamurella paurometabola (strain ATCC 8368 / DSM / CCUG 35730 / CIP 100753 / JCM 10117 / KCTC 9821 / NBRC 16120 / NCIMB 702349/ NCTC 13040) OX=521096 GN=Tpau_2426 PE=3 SV=1 [Tsukamurella paurometabola]|uniref:UspA domain protein n=1 Tax=Tsukamurella paurometabola (strain ATCC 8368 / DSM 20162 / CCUG 35730 / CIP 100753 / JCM 10117 / KCTC 9821 / NBRC 16120 / NCIMB 702349 / NCTC 13040) TaxID=521096 RepID=D5UR43_TSUPD|nr:universal stress protein [Tsukamurella paurometabola]ADG79032.1 UspA domain protein [Tsukamurella paurometabola DSM 20162]SUP33830.1 Universal stress protein Rv1636/MT1672 [Tsukamurella paurometabola]
MSGYSTVVVGTDGSESSLRAVDRAASIAGDNVKLVIACAYLPSEAADPAAADVLRDEAYQLQGANPVNDMLRTAEGRALKAGAKNVEKRAIKGQPVEALLDLVKSQPEPSLLVVGNKGMNSLTGRLLGSVPSDAARKTSVDILIVHTT